MKIAISPKVVQHLHKFKIYMKRNIKGAQHFLGPYPVYRLTSTIQVLNVFNPFMTYGYAHHYHLDESTFIFRGIRSVFQ